MPLPSHDIACGSHGNPAHPKKAASRIWIAALPGQAEEMPAGLTHWSFSCSISQQASSAATYRNLFLFSFSAFTFVTKKKPPRLFLQLRGQRFFISSVPVVLQCGPAYPDILLLLLFLRRCQPGALWPGILG